METFDFDITIIGAGIVGLAVSYELSKYNYNILLVEKEESFGKHISSRNSEVIHSGIYYHLNSLKAKLCVEGNKLLYNFADKYDIQYNNCGKYILGHSESDVQKLIDLKKNGKRNGVEGIRMVDSNQVLEQEPLINCYKALFIPSTGIIDSHAIMKKMEYLSKLNGVTQCYNLPVKAIKKYNDKYQVSFRGQKYKINTKILINCAGLWSDKISSMVGIDKYKIRFCKGDYYKINKYRHEINTLIYPLPGPISLGIHTVLHLDGTISFGPNAYYVNELSYVNTLQYKEIFFSEIKKYLNINLEDINIDFSGIRPKIQNINDEVQDFIIINEKDFGYNNFINLIGIDSPGLTSSMAIAKYVNNIIKI